MNDIRSRLQREDPVGRESGLAAADLAAIRERMLLADAAPLRSTGPARYAMGVALLVATAGAAWFVQLTPPPELAPAPAPTRSQLFFTTPGGTRLIWVFNSDFEVR
jgi:hypothetical protein